MDAETIIELAKEHLQELPGKSFSSFSIARPSNIDDAISLAKLHKTVSKISPLVSNLIEHDVIDALNQSKKYESFGKWVRQDPGFPDLILQGSLQSKLGFEIKTWYPFSTEITGRFKDSQSYFDQDQIYLALLAWLPSHLIYGTPTIVGALVTSGRSVAQARDKHYHNPPDYLVVEPEDTSTRTSNLKQTNTSGYKFQASDDALSKAKDVVKGWGKNGTRYKTTPDYQSRLRKLFQSFTYRLDTNYAKIDRIEHAGIEAFKSDILETDFHGMKISDWYRVFSKGTDDDIKRALVDHLGIREK